MEHSATVEKWAPLPLIEYSRAYEVSSLGRVRSIPRLASSEYFIRHIHGGFLKGRLRKDGSKTVTLSVQRKRLKIGIHDLVAMAFVANPDKLTAVKHINGDLADNRADNLAWGACENA